MVRKADVKAVENLGGGKGTAYVHHIISKEEMLGLSLIHISEPTRP